jgi:hypothetical protein
LEKEVHFAAFESLGAVGEARAMLAKVLAILKGGYEGEVRFDVLVLEAKEAKAGNDEAVGKDSFEKGVFLAFEIDALKGFLKFFHAAFFSV